MGVVNCNPVHQQDSDPKKFLDDVFKAECEELNKNRKKQLAASSPSSSLGLVGLALSGGGIRSATFNLGILQGMASTRKEGRSLLGYFDYLSTVSGGGYIGSWLVAWIKKQGAAQVEKELVVLPDRDGRAKEEDRDEPEPIRHLREYSNYLTPKVGLFSRDTWTAVATYFRNLTLNQLLLVSLLALALLIPRIFPGLLSLLGLDHPMPILPWNIESWELSTWGVPFFLILVVVAITIVVGISWKLGRMSDLKLERWAKRQGSLLTVAIAWASLFAISLYGPLGFELLKEWSKAESALIIGWLGTIVLGIFAGNSPLTGKAGGKGWLDYAARALTYIAMLGLLIMVAWGINWVLVPPSASHEAPSISCETTPTQARAEQLQIGQIHLEVKIQEGTVQPRSCELIQAYWKRIQHPAWLRVGLVFIVLMIIACMMGYLVDVNEFSMSAFYRNRLVRCYLRASPANGLNPNDDDPHLSSFSSFHGKSGKEDNGYTGPYPIINTTLNLTESQELQWQERKAASFVLTPRYCGSELSNLPLTWYRETADFAGNIKLGTAFAISGAAFSPNMGYHSSTPIAFFLSLFNVRLGWWVGNPRSPNRDVWTSRGPRVGFWYLLRELCGKTSEATDYVYLSDGGHFDNLGLYELVRRRCKYIVCCDAGADPAMSFEDIGNAIRKIRTDFSVDIEMDLDMLRRKDGQRYSQWHHAFGTIRYDLLEPGSPVGMLIYIKASLTGDEPVDVLEYAGKHADFPHESTLDQFFSESQFESYRRLGEHIAKEVFRYAQPSL